MAERLTCACATISDLYNAFQLCANKYLRLIHWSHTRISHRVTLRKHINGFKALYDCSLLTWAKLSLYCIIGSGESGSVKCIHSDNGSSSHTYRWNICDPHQLNGSMSQGNCIRMSIHTFAAWCWMTSDTLKSIAFCELGLWFLPFIKGLSILNFLQKSQMEPP